MTATSATLPLNETVDWDLRLELTFSVTTLMRWMLTEQMTQSMVDQSAMHGEETVEEMRRMFAETSPWLLALPPLLLPEGKMREVSERYASLREAARRAMRLLLIRFAIKIFFSPAGICSASMASACRSTPRAVGALARHCVCIIRDSLCHLASLWLSPPPSLAPALVAER